ncbi:helix-turn-helix domain-containing protein [Streptomyces netropsis]
MARPEKPIDPTAPYATFAQQLRKLRKSSGSPTYATLAWRTRYSVPALSQAAAGRKLPSLELTLAYATACGGSREHWTEQWLIAQHQAGPASLDSPATSTEVRPWSTRPPVPASAETPQEFIACLRELKLWAGNPSLSRLEDIARNGAPGAARLPRSTIGDALSPKRTSLPNAFVVRSLVLACLAFAQRQSRIRPEETGPVVEEWQERWLRLYRSEHRQRAPRTTARPPVLVEEAVEDTELPLPRPRVLRAPLDHVPPAQRILAEELRALFSELDMSLRGFAMRHYIDPSTVSRYLSGSRIPSRDFLQVLVREASVRRGQEPAPDTLQRLQALRRAALHARPSLPDTEQLDDLREALDDAQDRLRRNIALEAALKAELLSRQQVIAELETRLRELQGSRSPQSA